MIVPPEIVEAATKVAWEAGRRMEGTLSRLLPWDDLNEETRRTCRADAMPFIQLAYEAGFKAGQLPVQEVGVRVYCTTCQRGKKPWGRSMAAAQAGGLCTEDCPGYQQDPEPSDLWPGEQR